MILAPTDFAAFSQATGTPYPDSAQQKAALTPIVAEWKAEQQAAAAENRGPSALDTGLTLLGAAGLSAAGFAAFNALRRKGLDDAAAASIAKEVDATTRQSAGPVVQSTNNISLTPNPVAVARKKNGKIAFQTGFLAPGNIRGTAESRRRQEYQPNSLWNDSTYGPLLRAATTPQLQQELVDSISLKDPDLAQNLAAAIELRNSPTAGIVKSVKTEADLPDPSRVPEGVAYRVADTKALLTTRRGSSGGADWVRADAPGVRERLAPTGRAAYGSVTPDEIAEGEAPIKRPDKKNRAMAQPGYLLPDESSSAVIQLTDADLSPRARKEGYIAETMEDGSTILLDSSGRPVTFGDRSARALLNRPIAWSDLTSSDNYSEELPQGDDSGKLQFYMDREDEITRGGLEVPPATSADPRALRLKQSFGWDLIPAQSRVTPDGRTVVDLPYWAERPYEGGVYIGKTVGELPRGDIQDDYVQAKPSDTLARAAGAFNAGTLDRASLDAIASRYNVPPREIAEAAARARGDITLPEPSGYQAPPAHAVGGRTNADWLTQALSALQVAPRPAEAASTADLLSDDPAVRASAARGWLGSNSEIAETLSTILSPLPATDRLSVVAEGLGNAARDFKTAIDWAASSDPELAPHLTGGRGTPSFDQFAKSYVRRFALGAVAEEGNAGSGRAALINLPADVSELIGTRAVQSGRSPDAVINELIGSADSPVEALWKLDGELSNAASSNLDEPYTTGSKLAERFWDQSRPGDGTGVGNLKARLGATSQQGYSSQDPNFAGTSRLPIAIKFGSHIKGADNSALLNPDQAAVDAVITNAVSGTPRTWTDESVVDPSIRSRPRGRSALEQAMGDGATGRSFPINATLKNRAADLVNQIKRTREQLGKEGMNAEQRNAAVAPLEAEIQSLADTQLNQLDALRQEGELLLSRANESPVTASGERIGTGRGYVLDIDPQSGKAKAMPDSFTEMGTTDRPESGDDGREFFDRSLVEDLQREGTLDTQPAVSEPSAAAASDRLLREYGHGTRDASLNFTSLGPGPDAASGKLRDDAISELRRQGYGEAYQPAGSERLSTPELALRVARAHLNRAHTLTPTAVNAVPAGPSEADAAAARASITGDYWDAVVSRGGFRPTKSGAANLNGMAPFTPPSDATIAGRVNFLRKRGIL